MLPISSGRGTWRFFVWARGGRGGQQHSHFYLESPGHTRNTHLTAIVSGAEAMEPRFHTVPPLAQRMSAGGPEKADADASMGKTRNITEGK